MNGINNAGEFNKRNLNYLQNNRLLHKFQDRALKIIGELNIERDDFSLDDFEKKYRVESNPVEQNIFYFWDEIIGEMISAGRTGNARANKDTFHSLHLFNKTTRLTFKDITPTFLSKLRSFFTFKRWQRWRYWSTNESDKSHFLTLLSKER